MSDITSLCVSLFQVSSFICTYRVHEIRQKSSLSRPELHQTVLPEGTPSFILGPNHKSYKNQFANIYFIRLHHLRKTVERKAEERWRDVAGEHTTRYHRSVSLLMSFIGSPELVPRVLDVIKSTLCYIVGTVYMEMKKKPNILEDVGRDVREKEIASLFVVNVNLL